MIEDISSEKDEIHDVRYMDPELADQIMTAEKQRRCDGWETECWHRFVF